jgi:hypothetical protein
MAVTIAFAANTNQPPTALEPQQEDPHMAATAAVAEAAAVAEGLVAAVIAEAEAM